MDAPSVLADGRSIRTVWSYRGDLWTSVSADGRRFSRPAKLPMPISSGWMERAPQCLRDESGRYVLVFRSDRNAQHQERAYVCWSRDFKNWSRPTQVFDRSVRDLDLIQDDRGRFVWAESAGNAVSIFVSRDAYRWEKLAEPATDGTARELSLIQRADGGYELFVIVGYDAIPQPGRPTPTPTLKRLWRYVSRDGRKWTRDRQLLRISRMGNVFLDAMHVKGRTQLALFLEISDMLTSRLRLFRETADGGWERSAPIPGATSPAATMRWSPRWGYLLGWKVPQSHEIVTPPSGPFLIRGKSLEALFPSR